jgi:hypothetical protein
MQISETMQGERNITGKRVKQERGEGENDPYEKSINRIPDNYIVRFVHNHPKSE